MSHALKVSQHEKRLHLFGAYRCRSLPIFSWKPNSCNHQFAQQKIIPAREELPTEKSHISLGNVGRKFGGILGKCVKFLSCWKYHVEPYCSWWKIMQILRRIESELGCWEMYKSLISNSLSPHRLFKRTYPSYTERKSCLVDYVSSQNILLRQHYVYFSTDIAIGWEMEYFQNKFKEFDRRILKANIDNLQSCLKKNFSE